MAQGEKASVKSGVSKEDLRRLMKEKSVKRIDSPFAKYDTNGQLFCVLCKSQVKSEIAWTAHINGRQHQQNLSAAQPKSAASSAFKKPEMPVKSAVVPAKQEKAMAKQVALSGTVKRPTEPEETDAVAKKPKLSLREIADMEDEIMADQSSASSNIVPKDFFDSPDITSSMSPSAPSEDPSASVPKHADSSTSLPDDFFDKPAKNVRQRQEREKQKQEEEEWAKFQKAIQEESHKSAMAVEQDDEEARKQKELDEIEEQMARWEKIHELEIKREQAKTKKEEPNVDESKPMLTGEDSPTDDEEDLELLDWRKRKLW